MKKYILYSIGLLMTVMAVQACKQDTLMTFNHQPSAYFSWLDDDKSRLRDSTEVKFVLIPDAEFTVNIPVKVTGALSDVDRQVAFMVVDTNTTALAQHYDLPEFVTIPAGKVEGNLSVRINRTADLSAQGAQVVKLTLRLLPNEQFNTDYREKLNTTTKKSRQVLNYSIYISDILVKPLWWGDETGTATSAVFGTYSKLKFLTICQANGFPPAFLDGTEEWNGITLGTDLRNAGNLTNYLQPAGKRTTVWLNRYAAENGTPFMDDMDTPDDPSDDVPMVMGNRGQL